MRMLKWYILEPRYSDFQVGCPSTTTELRMRLALLDILPTFARFGDLSLMAVSWRVQSLSLSPFLGGGGH